MMTAPQTAPDAVAAPVSHHTAPVPAPESCDSDRGTLALVCVTEPLDTTGAARFLEQVRAISRNSRCLVADLTHTEFVDSAGVRSLLAAAGELHQAEKELRLVIQPGSRVERTLKLLLLLDHFQVIPTLSEACGRQVAPA